jgi:outer membrane translocation and assembly module TamA
VTSPLFADKSDVDRPVRFGTIRSYANLDFVDNAVFPTTGVRWKNEANYFSEFGAGNRSFLQLKSDLSLYATPNFNFPATAALRIGGARNIGDYAFFQANNLGKNTHLRGYRNNRFAGKAYLYENAEVRFTATNFRNYLFTGNLGFFGFFDAGRVYSDVAESAGWHTGYGPGFWIKFYNKLLLSTGYGISKEGKYFTINGGLSF